MFGSFYYQYYIEDENGEWTTVSPSKVDVSQAQLKSQPPEEPAPCESTVYPHQEAANKDLSPYSVEQVMRRVYVKATPEKGRRFFFQRFLYILEVLFSEQLMVCRVSLHEIRIKTG